MFCIILKELKYVQILISYKAKYPVLYLLITCMLKRKFMEECQ
jgi:hypothetical protein